MANKIIREACVDSLELAILAERLGADRIELCARLDLDGITPDPTLIQEVLFALSIPVKVMIRPRGGDFVYSDPEFIDMIEAIILCKSLRVSEIATGVLLPDNVLDIERISQLATLAYPMETTIHKCIDLVPDINDAIAQLREIHGVNSVLSSGRSATAWEGRDTLKHMLEACGTDLTLIVAGKVTADTLPDIMSYIGASEYHGREIV